MGDGDEDYLKWDINYQNENGDTAFHVAISKDANIDVLRALLEKGVNVNIRNNDGKTPFECIIHGSLQTTINLLKLEKEFDLRDENGDSFLHVLMDRVGGSVWGIRRSEDGQLVFGSSEQEKTIEKFWDNILSHLDMFDINLNSQNKFGCTPLHIAADFWPSMKSLEVMLTYFEHVDPFLCDKNGDNFLHKYVLRQRSSYAPALHDKIFNAELRYLPRQSLVKLLNSQNTEKKTPLHILIKDGQDKTLKDLENILDAGADPNISDVIGNTALHCTFKKYFDDIDEDPENLKDISKFHDSTTEQIIQCLIKHGADVNAINQKGESVLFMANHPNQMKTLVALGANINQRNKLLQTPLLHCVTLENIDLETLEFFLNKGCDACAEDIHGSNVLHYIAWHGYHRDFLPALEKYKLKDKRDKIGQLPCDVACMQGHGEIFAEICQCKSDAHALKEHFNLTQDAIILSELIKDPEKIQEKFDRISTFRDEKMSKLLNLPSHGAVSFEGETSIIKNVTREIVESICKKLVEKNAFWKCKIIQSGSVGENSKVNSPNEFDFVLILEQLGEICYVDEQRSSKEQGYVYLKLKQEFNTKEYRKYFNEEYYLNPLNVRSELIEIVDDLYTTEDPFQHPYISFIKGDNESIDSPIFNFTFCWRGCLYKNLLVDIDLVPACQIRKWWPNNSNLDELQGDTEALKDEGAVLLLQTEMKSYSINTDCKVRVSAMSAEKEHILHLPQIARDAYMICKIICDRRICPDLHVKKDVPIKKALTSYMMKNTMFHVIHDISATAQIETNTRSEISTVTSASAEGIELYSLVKNIFHKLLDFSRDEKLPSFVFPWQNVFTFNNNVLPDDNHAFCAFRYAFIKVALSMLGEKQDFSDIDESVCDLAVDDVREDEESFEYSYTDEDELEEGDDEETEKPSVMRYYRLF